MPTYPTTEAAASPTATAVTELWTFSPTDTSDDDAWIPRNGATAVINLLDILLQVTATYSTCGPDGSTGIRMVRSAGSPLLILKIDLEGPATRIPGRERRPARDRRDRSHHPRFDRRDYPSRGNAQHRQHPARRTAVG